MDPSNNTRPAMVMTTLAWIAALAMVSWLFNGFLQRQENPNQNLDTSTNPDRSVTLKRNRQGHYLADGYINGSKVLFLLDTGATNVSVPKTIADRLKLKPMSHGIAITAAGNVETFGTRLEQVRLGPIVMGDVSANINPHMQTDEILLGMSFLKHLELIQRGNTLTLRQY